MVSEKLVGKRQTGNIVTNQTAFIEAVTDLDTIIESTGNTSVQCLCMLMILEKGIEFNMVSDAQMFICEQWPRPARIIIPLHQQLRKENRLYSYIDEEAKRVWYGFNCNTPDKAAIKSLVRNSIPDAIQKQYFNYFK
jgi:hypothetical protein